MEWCMFRYFLIRVNVNISRLKWKLNKWTIIGEQKFQLFVTSAWLMDLRPIFYARLFDLSTLRFSLNTEQYFWLFFCLINYFFLVSFQHRDIRILVIFFRKWYITFQYFSKFINIKFNIKKYQDTGEFYSFNGFSRWNRAVSEHFHIYYKCKILYKNIFVLKDVKNPSITCLDYLHVRQSPPLP